MVTGERGTVTGIERTAPGTGTEIGTGTGTETGTETRSLPLPRRTARQ